MAYIDCENCYHGKVCQYRRIYHDMVVVCEHWQPTADVVPKSAVETLEREFERLKKSMLPSYYQACTEEEAIKIGKEYGKQEAAREIFEEIEKILIDSDYIPDCARFVDIDKLAELKKKYTGGE